MSSCVLAVGARMRDGYVKQFVEGKRVLAHRVAYAKSKSISLESIKDLVVRHVCDNPACINPEHLALGTQKQNIQDCVTRNIRSPNRPKFSFESAELIRKEFGTLQTIAKKYNTSVSVVSNIINRKGAYK